MKIRTKWLGIAAAAFSVAAIAGSASAQDKRTIALVYGIKGDAFYVTMEKGAQAKADELGVTLLADGPSQWNPAIQTPIVDAMIARKVDGLIAVPNDPQAMIAVLQRANDMGIPVVTTDQFIGDGDYANGSVTFPLSYVASDNFGGGKLACETLIEGMGGKGTLYVLVSTPNVPSDVARRDGCLAAVEATNGAVELAGVDYTQSNATIATTQTQAALQKNPNITAIFGGNLFSAQGASAAVKTANLAGTVKIASFDAPEQAIDDLRAEVVDIVIAQQPALIGATAVQYIVDALDGKTADIPRKLATPFVVITRENVDTPEAQAAIYKDK
ncbi:MAG: substrate-binding domain-containing protein [Bauldia sp.]|uniref:ABC transporter substrate-binding protein n=1 Tax=Bauldia sp. TaxID=2575872 RepID=UPI001E0EFF84|nr:ABC transporter substrate-binding protein [Bauldia sp.]MCB1497354.1 substrate-binding domain-containing protein [Bauldia sp.]